MVGSSDHARLTVDERKEYAAEIKRMVSAFSLTYTWLIRQLSDEGLITDKFEMSSTLAGTRTGDKPDQILQRSLGILLRYQENIPLCRGS